MICLWFNEDTFLGATVKANAGSHKRNTCLQHHPHGTASTAEREASRRARSHASDTRESRRVMVRSRWLGHPTKLDSDLSKTVTWKEMMGLIRKSVYTGTRIATCSSLDHVVFRMPPCGAWFQVFWHTRVLCSVVDASGPSRLWFDMLCSDFSPLLVPLQLSFFCERSPFQSASTSSTPSRIT